jgi:hypothetical protein
MQMKLKSPFISSPPSTAWSSQATAPLLLERNTGSNLCWWSCRSRSLLLSWAEPFCLGLGLSWSLIFPTKLFEVPSSASRNLLGEELSE